ncbi:hypothetical protein GCM10028824_36600 [Hymenobacter segetis]
MFRPGQSAGGAAGEGPGGYKLSITNAAPGTFFAVLGAVIILATVLKGYTAGGLEVEDGGVTSQPVTKPSDNKPVVRPENKSVAPPAVATPDSASSLVVPSQAPVNASELPIIPVQQRSRRRTSPTYGAIRPKHREERFPEVKIVSEHTWQVGMNPAQQLYTLERKQSATAEELPLKPLQIPPLSDAIAALQKDRMLRRLDSMSQGAITEIKSSPFQQTPVDEYQNQVKARQARMLKRARDRDRDRDFPQTFGNKTE